MPYCPQCGTEYDSEDAFCGNCGEKLFEEHPTTDDSIETSVEYEVREETPRSDSTIETKGDEAFKGSPGMVRKIVGGASGLVVVFGLLLAFRQFRLWSSSGDGYYLVSGGWYVVIIVLLWSGVAWGFFRGERAKRLFGVVAGIAGLICFLAALYFWLTGHVLGRNINAIFSALVWGLTGVVLYAVAVGLPKLVTALSSEPS